MVTAPDVSSTERRRSKFPGCGLRRGAGLGLGETIWAGPIVPLDRDRCLDLLSNMASRLSMTDLFLGTGGVSRAIMGGACGGRRRLGLSRVENRSSEYGAWRAFSCRPLPRFDVE